MTAFIIRRFFLLGFVLLGVTILVFGLYMTFNPELKALLYVSNPIKASPEAIHMVVERYCLDCPFYVQYGLWIREIFRGNFGWSLVASSSVVDAFFRYFPTTMELNLFSIPLIIFIGIWLGTLAGIHRDTWIDTTSRTISIIGWSLPTFIFGLLLLALFYGGLKWFPPGVISSETGLYILNHPDTFIRYTGMYTIDGVLNGEFWISLDALRHLVLPVVTQVFASVAFLVRIMRSGMLETLSQDYILTAIAKGADKHAIHYKHARRNALIPVITLSGTIVATLVTGSIVVEYIFQRHGMGWWIAAAANWLDIATLMFNCLFIGSVLVITNLIVDILYAYIDPRIRFN